MNFHFWTVLESRAELYKGRNICIYICVYLFPNIDFTNFVDWVLSVCHSYQDANGFRTDYDGLDYYFNDFDLVATDT